MVKKTKSHTPFGQICDGIRDVAATEADMGGPPREFKVSDESIWPFKDGRVAEQAEQPKGNLAPDVEALTKSTKSRVKTLGAEGGTISGKKGDRLNPNGDQDDDENGSVHPDQHVRFNSTAWADVVRTNLEKRKRVARQDEFVDEDERRQIVEDIQEFIESQDFAALAEEVVGMAEMIESLQAEKENLQNERDDLTDEILHQQLLLHVADFTKSMSLAQAQRFLDRALDVVDMAKMSIDNQYLAKTLGRLKEEVVREGRRPPRAGTNITEGFADYESLRDERVMATSDKGMRAVQDALKIFRK